MDGHDIRVERKLEILPGVGFSLNVDKLPFRFVFFKFALFKMGRRGRDRFGGRFIVKNAQAQFRVLFYQVDASPDFNSFDSHRLIGTGEFGKVDFHLLEAPSCGTLSRVDSGCFCQASAERVHLHGHRNSQPAAIGALCQLLHAVVQEGGQGRGVIAVTQGGILVQGLDRVVEEASESAGVQLGLGGIVFLHFQHMLQIETEGAFQVIAESSDAETAEDGGIFRRRRDMKGPGTFPGRCIGILRGVLHFFGKKMQRPARKLGRRTAQQQPAGFERIAQGILPAGDQLEGASPAAAFDHSC